jgi:hypothetical protein
MDRRAENCKSAGQIQGPVGIDVSAREKRKNDTSQGRKRKAIRRLEHMTLARHSKNQDTE